MGSLSKIRLPYRLSIPFLLAVICLTLMGPTVETAKAHSKFGFRGGFRGNFGRSFHRGRSFNNRRLFGFGGFNRFNQINKFGFVGGRSRFNSFRPRFNTFTFSHFPVTRIHSGFGTFHQPVTFVANRFSTVPNHFTTVRLPSTFVAGNGWTHLANGQIADARTAFVNDISTGGSPGIARVGFALAAAEGGDLDKGVWAMRRAFEADKDMAASLMMDDSMSELVARVTRLYEQRMEDKGNNADDAFMLAAMYQLQGDPEMAMMAMDVAKDGQVSTANLGQLIESEMASIPMTNSAAWELLAAGDNSAAVTTFIEEITKDPTAGAPKLGYALAMAAGGDLEKGTWALRRAFEIDPEGASDVMLSGKHRSVVEGVTEKYVSDAEAKGINKDNSYSLATLFMLQGDIEAAEMIVKNSPVDPDSYVASMIVDEMKSQMSMMKVAMVEMDDPKDHTYDEFVASEEGSGTKDLTSPGSGSKEPVAEGSSSKNLVEDGSSTKELSPGSGSKAIDLEAPDFEATDLEAPPELKGPSDGGSGTKLPTTNGSSSKVPAGGGSGTK